MAHKKVTKTGTQYESGTPNTFSYSGSFDVFKAAEVEVELDNVALTFTTSTINESASPREYTVDYNNKTVHVGGANLTSSNSVVILPVTDLGKLTNEEPKAKATYQPGASITSADLNNNQLQLMRKALEYDEQKLSSRGGTMTGNLHLAKDIDLSFEGATNNAHETTLTVTDPTADRTITLPNVTGTVVTTGDTGTVATAMIAADAITGAKIADDQINSEHYADGSIDTAHIANSQITSAKIANGTIVADDLASDAVTTVKITDLNVTTAKIAADAITGAKIADDAVDSEHLAADSIDAEHYAAGSVDTTALGADAVTGAKIADNAIDSEHYTDGSIDTAHIGNSQVTTAKIAADNITNALIADNQIDSEHYVDGSIDTAHIANTQVTDAKLASNSVTTSKITDANVTTVKIADSNITLAKLANDLKQTTISDSDTQIPTSGAVVDYVTAQIAPIGGLEVIANEDSFPTTQPSAGVVISINDIEGLITNGSGVATNARTSGNGSDNVTINGFPSSLYSKTMAAGLGLMVSSTGSSQTYTYHKLLAKEADVEQLSNDINDFAARYRVGSSNPTTSLDSGDLFFNTGTGKLLVYNGTNSAWEEAQSIGNYYINTISSYSGTGGNSASFNNNAYRFVLSNPGTTAEQHIVSVNGVIQKPNAGTSQPGEGFAIDGSSIIFSSPPATNADYFIITIGSTVNIGTPSDNTVTTAKLTSGAVTTVKIADDAVNADKLASNSVVSASIVDGSIVNADVNASAAIAGTKISPDFGSQNVVTTGTLGSGDLTITSAAPALLLTETNGDPDYKIQSNAGVFKLVDTTNSADRLVVNTSGNVGIGTASPNKLLHIQDAAISGYGSQSGTLLVVEDTGDTSIEIASGHNNTGSIFFGDTGASNKGQINYLHGTGGDAMTFFSNGSERMRIDSSGNVGIGTTSPSNKLEIENTTSDKGILLKSTGNNYHTICGDANRSQATDNILRLDAKWDGNVVSRIRMLAGNDTTNKDDGIICFDTDSGSGMSERMRINSSGQVLIGTTSSGGPGGLTISPFHDDGACTLIFDRANTSDTSTVLAFENNNSGVGSITHGNSSTAYNTSSDYRLKENATAISDGITRLKTLKPYRFNFKIDPDRTVDGFYAHEVTAVPEAISGTKDEVDSDNKPVYQGIDQSKLVPLLTAALQEAVGKIETLETKVAALEAK